MEMQTLQSILNEFYIFNTNKIEQIHKSAWNVDDKYILKMNSDSSQLDKSIAVNQQLFAKNIPVAKYLQLNQVASAITILTVPHR